MNIVDEWPTRKFARHFLSETADTIWLVTSFGDLPATKLPVILRQPNVACDDTCRRPVESLKGSSGASSMCASRSRQSYTGASRSNHDRNPQDDPYHPYYPAGYPRWPLYDPCAAYHYHSGAFYPMAPPYCAHHEVAKREIASWWSWFTILLLVFLVAGIWVGIACYRKLSNDTRRKIAVWLARFPLQVIAPVVSASASSRSRGALIRPYSGKEREKEREKRCWIINLGLYTLTLYTERKKYTEINTYYFLNIFALSLDSLLLHLPEKYRRTRDL